jgi:hypothetical protein
LQSYSKKSNNGPKNTLKKSKKDAKSD